MLLLADSLHESFTSYFRLLLVEGSRKMALLLYVWVFIYTLHLGVWKLCEITATCTASLMFFITFKYIFCFIAYLH
jgi:hypothetical protein